MKNRPQMNAYAKTLVDCSHLKVKNYAKIKSQKTFLAKKWMVFYSLNLTFSVLHKIILLCKNKNLAIKGQY